MATVAMMPLGIGGTSSSSSTPTPIATASGLLALLSEPDTELVQHALTKLLSVVDTLWHEVAEALPDLEAIAEGGAVGDLADGEDEDVAMATTGGGDLYDEPTKKTAAALASRVFFHLEEPRQALRLALESGDEHFNVLAPTAKDGAYVERLVNAAIGEYVARKQKEFDGSDDSEEKKGEEGEEEEEELDMAKLQNVVHLMFQRCYQDGSYGHALGVAFEAREAQKVEEILNKLGDSSDKDANSVVETLRYALDAAHNLIPSKSFRGKALGLIATSLAKVFSSDGASASAKRNAACTLVLCRQMLGDASAVGEIIVQLIDGSDGENANADEDSALLGLQLCFDIVDSGDQAFVTKVASCLPKQGESSDAAIVEGSTAEGSETVEVDSEGNAAAPAGGANERSVELEQSKARTEETWTHFTNAHRILTGGFTSELALSFLYKNSNADKLIMSNLKKALEERSMSRNSVLHNCAVTAHGYLNQGTTNDDFLRDNLDWMKKASNWAKFSATASMGVIHAGHTTEAMTLLEPYLPPSAPADDPNAAHPTVSSTGGYAEGGSLYALGLIHGSHAGSSTEKRLEASAFLRQHLRNSHANEVISHGAALGVGLTSFGSANLDVVNELKELLYTDSAVAGEAASIAMGMVLVGSGAGNAATSGNEELAEIVAELRNYSRETHHEKIIRGIAMCLALVNFGQEENADASIEEMRSDRDPIIRYGAMYGLALAYCGTGSNKAIRILLHTAVSDVSDDVRMASVIGLALVLHKTPERVPELVKLLLESFNPHVRYASCMAVGIAMAGTGDANSVALLEPMLTDMADHVRQGALLGTAMIYMQQSDTCNHRKIKTFREKLASLIGDKHQTTLTKMGAILSTGLLDVGGRNCALSLGSRNGFTKMTSAAGLVLWLQHWHWYPLMHMLSLAVTPTCTIGLNKDFKYPKKFEILCQSKPSAYAYPKKLEEKKEEKKKRVETVTLSTTAKNQARLARKRAKEEAESGEGGEGAAMDVDKKEEEGGKDEKKEKSENMDVDGGDAEDAKETKPAKKKREPEPTSFRIPNPARITTAQANVCTFDLDQRYRPVRPETKPYGVIMLTDSTPGEDEDDLGAVKTPAQEDEADPPEAFEWTPPGHPDHPDTVKTGEKDESKADAAEAETAAAE
jgi:26S proteasome regulatory subunit N2